MVRTATYDGNGAGNANDDDANNNKANDNNNNTAMIRAIRLMIIARGSGLVGVPAGTSARNFKCAPTG